MPPKRKPTKKNNLNGEQSKKTKDVLTKKQGKAKDEDSDSDEDDYLESDSEESVDENFDDGGEESDEVEDDKESEIHESEDEDDEEEAEDDEDDCVYKFASNKPNLSDEDDEIPGEEVYFEEDEKLIQDAFVPDDKRVTKTTLTKYERVRILGERTKQLSLGAKPMMKNVLGMHPKEIAQLELDHGVLPIFIIRTLPTGQKERWRVSELKVIN